MCNRHQDNKPALLISRVFFPPQFRESNSPCITSAVCPVFSLWTTCTQRSWTGRGCRTLCQRSLGSGRAGREICNTIENTSCMYSAFSPFSLCVYILTECHTAFMIMSTQWVRVSVEESEEKHQLTAQVYPEVWHSPCLLRT